MRRFFQSLASVIRHLFKTFRSVLGKSGHVAQIEEEKRPEPLPTAPNVVRQYEEHDCEHYMELKYHYRDIGRMKGIAETLGRDFLTAMPEGAWKSRLGQLAFLYRRIHNDLTSDRVTKLLDQAKNHRENHNDSWDDWDSANLREMEAMHVQQRPLDADLVEKRARLSYEGRRQHRDCLAAQNWQESRKFLSSMVDLNKQVAEAKAKAHGEKSLYDVLLHEYMPGINEKMIEGWFGQAEKKLKKILPKIIEHQSSLEPPMDITDFYPAKAQMWLNHALLSSIGFDFNRGGLYETGHNPVEGGTPDDTRLVIKNVDINNFLDSMKSALHEGGHGIYIQGLPRKVWRYQPVAQDMGAAIHESQALLIEMIISRTHDFFTYLSPRVEGLFHGLHNPVLTADNLYKLKTWVKPGAMRKRADEVTYFFHIIHRFRLERDLINEKITVDDIPEVWNAELKNLLDVQPQGMADGCLQDVHWFVGKFGYFPSYAIGHMLSAQLYHTIEKQHPQTRSNIRAGQYGYITDWLRTNIHRKGRLLSFDDLVKSATGESLTTTHLIQHIERRYLKER